MRESLAAALLCSSRCLNQSANDVITYTESAQPSASPSRSQRVGTRQHARMRDPLHVHRSGTATWQASRASIPEPRQAARFAFYANRATDVYCGFRSRSSIGKACRIRRKERSMNGTARIVIMVIDTLKPVVRTFQAQRQGDEVLVTWDVQEDHPDLAAARALLDGISDQGCFVSENWKQVPITSHSALKGQAEFQRQRIPEGVGSPHDGARSGGESIVCEPGRPRHGGTAAFNNPGGGGGSLPTTREGSEAGNQRTKCNTLPIVARGDAILQGPKRTRWKRPCQTWRAAGLP